MVFHHLISRNEDTTKSHDDPKHHWEHISVSNGLETFYKIDKMKGAFLVILFLRRKENGRVWKGTNLPRLSLLTLARVATIPSASFINDKFDARIA